MDTSKFIMKNHGNRVHSATNEISEMKVTGAGFSSDHVQENINSTPIGRLLKIVASLPEIRQEKVTDIRRQIDCGQYNLIGNLDEALDKIIEELLFGS
jgi:hypothetical protein